MNLSGKISRAFAPVGFEIVEGGGVEIFFGLSDEDHDDSVLVLVLSESDIRNIIDEVLYGERSHSRRSSLSNRQPIDSVVK